jgi:hypothetical protein
MKYDIKVQTSKDTMPLVEKDGYHCQGKCKNLCIYDHPYYHLTAWCSYLGEELRWYDFWLAACTINKSNEEK